MKKNKKRTYYVSLKPIKPKEIIIPIGCKKIIIQDNQVIMVFE